jgi:hypothetical protein
MERNVRCKTIDGLRSGCICGFIFPATTDNFYRRKSGSLSSECKICSRQRNSRNQKKRYYAASIDFHIKYITRNSRQRARKNKISFEIDCTYVFHLLEIQDGLCAISKVPLTFIKGEGHIHTNASLDRINPGVGYTKGNVHLVAWQVNVMKSNLDITQLAEWCQKVLQGLSSDTDSTQDITVSE